jgi:hypothetical protein
MQMSQARAASRQFNHIAQRATRLAFFIADVNLQQNALYDSSFARRFA